MLPLEIYLIKGLGWLHAVAFIAATRRSARSSLCSSAVFNSSTGRRGLLAAFRACMLLWSLFIGLNQLADKGVIVLTYFTVWNWWFMTLFFALATLASLRALHRVRCGGQDAASRPADVLEHAAVVAFAVEAPTCLVVDFMTWTVLVPMLLSSADPERVTHWERIFYSFESMNQHGLNAVMMLGELALGCIPLKVVHSGYMALLASLYGVHSAIFFARTGRFIYPFLDAHKPHAWLGYVGLYAIMFSAFMLVLVLTRARDWLLKRFSAAGQIKAA